MRTRRTEAPERLWALSTSVLRASVLICDVRVTRDANTENRSTGETLGSFDLPSRCLRVDLPMYGSRGKRTRRTGAPERPSGLFRPPFSVPPCRICDVRVTRDANTENSSTGETLGSFDLRSPCLRVDLRRTGHAGCEHGELEHRRDSGLFRPPFPVPPCRSARYGSRGKRTRRTGAPERLWALSISLLGASVLICDVRVTRDANTENSSTGETLGSFDLRSPCLRVDLRRTGHAGCEHGEPKHRRDSGLFRPPFSVPPC